jgi:hypothetical protein
MSLLMPSSPGTVSKILWHFTGGPRWNETEQRQEVTPKPPSEAFSALISILASQEVRRGGYREVIHVTVPHMKDIDPATRIMTVKHDEQMTLASSPVCCLAEIPIQHLGHHADRYGKMAIGFHRETIIKKRFSPVSYQLDTSNVLWSIYVSFAKLKELGAHDIEYAVSEAKDKISRLNPVIGYPLGSDAWEYFHPIEGLANAYVNAIAQAKEKLENFLAYIKTFKESEFETIYTEREWRSTDSLKFDDDQIAMIIIPRCKDEGDYYEQFIEKHPEQLGLPRSVPIVAWEDLVEH